jgi:hypothetical protein
MLDEVAAKLKTTFVCSRNRCVRTREGEIGTQLGQIAKANPEVAIGSYPFFDCSTAPSVVLRTRDAAAITTPKLADSHLTLRFTADVFPRFSSISYSICCPSLSALNPARSTAEMCTNTSLPPPLRLNESIALGWIKPLHRAARHCRSPN